MAKTPEKTDEQKIEELFNHMLGKEIDSIEVNQEELVMTLSDDTLIVFYSSDGDLDLYYEMPPKLN